MSVKQISSFGSSSENTTNAVGSEGCGNNKTADVCTSVPADNFRDDIGLKSDEAVKTFFSFKEVMGLIINEVLPEFKGMRHSEVMEYFEKDKNLNKIKLEESVSKRSGVKEVRYDLRFRIKNSGYDLKNNKYVSVRFFVDFEMQRKRNPGYSLVRRGIYYCARMIDDQLVSGDDYDRLEKVYSIWVVPDALKEKQNIIDWYHITNQDNEATVESDLMGIFFLWVGDEDEETGEKVFDFLHALFSGKDVKERVGKYVNIEEDNELRKVVDDMSGLTEHLLEKGREERDKEIIVKMYEKGMNLETISQIIEIPKQKVEEIIQSKKTLVESSGR